MSGRHLRMVRPDEARELAAARRRARMEAAAITTVFCLVAVLALGIAGLGVWSLWP